MKIITWNYQGAFRKKIEPNLTSLPDILIIQKCECFSFEQLKLKLKFFTLIINNLK